MEFVENSFFSGYFKKIKNANLEISRKKKRA